MKGCMAREEKRTESWYEQGYLDGPFERLRGKNFEEFDEELEEGD